MKTLIDWVIRRPERVAKHLGSLAPLFARIVVGWVFLWSGWGKLNNLPAMIENFARQLRRLRSISQHWRHRYRVIHL
jgi:putative oxidoreductase